MAAQAGWRAGSEAAAGVVAGGGRGGPVASGSPDQAQALETQVAQMRRRLLEIDEAAQLKGASVLEASSSLALATNAPAEAIALRLDLATMLQHLNHLKPDGGKRVEESERLYR